MSKRDGTLFSTALFGYKKSDVNDYIKKSDAIHVDQISLLRSEKDRLLVRAQNAEARVEELEKIIARYESRAKSSHVEHATESSKTSAKGKQESAVASSNNKAEALRKRMSFLGTVKKK